METESMNHEDTIVSETSISFTDDQPEDVDEKGRKSEESPHKEMQSIDNINQNDTSMKNDTLFTSIGNHSNLLEHVEENTKTTEEEQYESILNVNMDVQEEQQNNVDENETKVFPGSRLNLGSFMVLMMTFILKYSLTGEGLSDILNIIDLLCPSENLLLKSITSFKRWFQHIKHPLKVHKYCSFCHLGINEQNIVAKVCPNELCKHVLNDSSVSHFIEIPIAEQIKSFFTRSSFMKDIQYRFTRKKVENSIEDIYDGEIYRALCQDGGILQNPYNLSLLWNTDGIPCFKSSNMSLWPLFFQINELQYSKRTNSENMILGGLWFGPKKPTMMSYTEPFVKTLQELETSGIEINSSINSEVKEPFICKVVVIGGTADLPARSVVCNTIQFNGKYGCCKCFQPGETCKTSERGHCHIFPFREENPSGPKRTHEEYLKDIENAVTSNATSRGIKGPSFLQCLTFYNLVSGTCIDYMHGILLGVTKLLMSLWFLPEHKGKAFSLSLFTGLVDKRLKNLKPPNNISRLPRSINDHLKYWKASEFRSFLLYYSLPVLRDIQSKEYFQHYLLLVNAVYILLKDSISAADIDKSNALLTHFCCLFAALYGDRYMTCNIHQLLHLPDMVVQMGPLWAYSCFSFENANGNVLKFFNGTQNVDFQIVETVNLMQTLLKLEKLYLKPNSSEETLYKSMKGTLSRNDHLLEGNIYLVGGTKKKKLSVIEMSAVAQFLGHVPHHYVTFNRIKIRNEIFHSKCYTRVHSRNSYTVAYNKPNKGRLIGQIAFYLQLFPFCEKHLDVTNLCKCKTVNVAMINQLEKHNVDDICKISHDELSGADLEYIDVLQPVNLNHFDVVPLQEIMYKCVFVKLADKKDVVYACRMPNYVEKD